MRKKLFLAIAMIAYAANGFASNEVTNTLEESDINPPSSTISLQEGVEKLEGPGYGICSTVEYRKAVYTIQDEYTGMDGQVYTTTSFYYVTTGACTTCIYINGTTKNCWGYGY